MAVVNELRWALYEKGTDLLERAGIAAMYMALRAARDGDEDLSPLEWRDDDLQSDSVTVRWRGSAKQAFMKLMRWAWQVRDGVLFLPAVHDRRDRAQWWRRVPMHNGIMGTVFQHNRVQPRAGRCDRVVRLDEDREVLMSFFALDSEIKPHKDVEDLFVPRSGDFKVEDIRLASWLSRGESARYPSDATGSTWNSKPWQGAPARALMLMLAPTTFLYHRVKEHKSDWVFVVPDVQDLDQFDSVRRRIGLSVDATDVASLGDAGLRFFAESSTRGLRSNLLSGCRVVAHGIASYFHTSNATRKAVLDVAPNASTLRRYRLLHREFPNVYGTYQVDATSDTRATSRRREGSRSLGQAPRAAGRFRCPSIRGRIADNIVSRRGWYADLRTPLVWDHEEAARERKRLGVSLDRAWFQILCQSRSKLMRLVAEDDMWDREAEQVFVHAFWKTMDSLYRQEADAVRRGGAASIEKRWERLEGELYRSLMQAKTRVLLRGALSAWFARAGRLEILAEHTPAIWRLIAEDWQKGRDLALLAMASHRKRSVREGIEQEDEDKET